jgi:predicted nucleic acid-binding protein
MDAIIAATALVHDLDVWPQDDDFDILARLASELRISSRSSEPRRGSC